MKGVSPSVKRKCQLVFLRFKEMAHVLGSSLSKLKDKKDCMWR